MAQAADDQASIKVEVEKWAWVPADSIDRIAWHALEKRVCECPEAAARSNSQFREAPAHVWIMSLRPDLIDRIEMAAGVPLRRR